MEVGPAARVVNTCLAGTNPRLKSLTESLLKKFDIGLEHLPSVMGRHLSRAVCASEIVQLLKANIEQLEPGVSGFIETKVPANARGYGLTEATRGALAHWIETDARGFIKQYEMIVPTTWNISPRDASDRHGAVEKMLVGTRVADPANPLELTRIIRSTDPCMSCSVH
jgi:Ni,Fe-hydrogenase I large subunit